MLGLIGLLGFIGIPVGLVMLIVSAVRKKHKKPSLLVLGISLAVYLLCVMLSPTVETQPPVENVTTGGTSGNVSQNIEDYIEVSLAPVEDRYFPCVGAIIKNNSDVTIGELDIQILFYNENGDIINIEDDGHDVVLPGSTVVTRVDAPDEYARYDYKLSVDVGANSRYKNHAANVDVKTNIGADCLILQITNNADVVIEEFEYAVVLYKDDKIVGVSYGKDVRDIPIGETVIEEYETGTEFDKYEVYVNQAHTF